MTTQQEMNTGGLSVVLGTYNRKSFLKLAIESIRKELLSVSFPHEIIVVDGGSTDGTLHWLEKQKDIITIVQHNRGSWHGKEIERRSWGYFINLSFRTAQGKYICMLSDDCLVVPGSILNGYNELEEQLKINKKIGGAAFYWRDWPEKETYFIFNTKNKNVLINHGIFLKKVLEEVGYIDEDGYFFYHADSDLCMKIWEKGYRIIESPYSFIEHYAHANVFVRKTNSQKQQEDWKTFYSRWKNNLDLSPEITTDIWMITEKKYDDPNKTIDQFKLLHLLNSWYYILRPIHSKIKIYISSFIEPEN